MKSVVLSFKKTGVKRVLGVCVYIYYIFLKTLGPRRASTRQKHWSCVLGHVPGIATVERLLLVIVGIHQLIAMTRVVEDLRDVTKPLVSKGYEGDPEVLSK